MFRKATHVELEHFVTPGHSVRGDTACSIWKKGDSLKRIPALAHKIMLRKSDGGCIPASFGKEEEDAMGADGPETFLGGA